MNFFRSRVSTNETIQLAVQSVLKLMKDPEKWDEAREALKSPPLAPADFKECFRTYSDADPEQHLAFDLYRIQAQDALKVDVDVRVACTRFTAAFLASATRWQVGRCGG